MSELAELRKIIVGQQAEQLNSIKERLDEVALRSKDVAEVLPEAISQASETRREKLNKAISPLISSSIKETIQKDPEGFANIFYPIMLPSIRLTIANMFRSFTSSMDQTIESATSLKGLKWRFESMRTGIPYSELALRKALQYRVEQVFVIQPGTGLLIEHVLNENVHGIDSDAVSGMLTAIQSFVVDSFDAKSGDNLTNLQVGDLKVWLIHGPQALIACVIRGDAPNVLRGQLIDILDQLHIKHAAELSEFDGDDKIDGVYDIVEPSLQLKLKEYEGKKSKIFFMPNLIFLALILGLVYWAWVSFDKSKMRNQSSKLLSQTPGLLATDFFWSDGKLNVVGLIDPMAEVPWDGLQKIGLSKDRVSLEMKQYRSLEPAILSKRIQKQYAFPDDLVIDVQGSGDIATARLVGDLSYADYRSVKNISLNAATLDVDFDISQMHFVDGTISEYVRSTIGIPLGVSIRDENGVVFVEGIPDVEWLKLLQKQLGSGQVESEIKAIVADDFQAKLRGDIRSEVVFFEMGKKNEVSEQSKVSVIANKINDLQTVLAMQKKTPKIAIIGSTDGDNTTEFNTKLRAKRAAFLYQKFIEIGIAPSILEIQENKNLYGDNIRGVKFRVLKDEVLIIENNSQNDQSVQPNLTQ